MSWSSSRWLAVATAAEADPDEALICADGEEADDVQEDATEGNSENFPDEA